MPSPLKCDDAGESLRQPLEAAVAQIAKAYLQAVSSQTPDKFITRLRRILQRDDILKANEEIAQPGGFGE